VGLEHATHAFGRRDRQRKRMRWAPACLSALTASAAERPSRAWIEHEEIARVLAEGILK